MLIAPIIHTRTFNCDFNSEFLVRPDKFMDKDIKWARKNVLDSTGSIDALQGVRWLIVDNKKYRVAGIVGFLKDICLKCKLSDENRKKSEELFCDNKGRAVYAFIGIVIDKQNNVDYGIPTYDYLWNLYFEKIYTIWKNSYQEVILESFIDVEFNNKVDKIDMESVKVRTMEMYETNQATDYELFSYLLCDKDKSDFSYCSNIQDFNLLKQSNFSIITTSQNIITRVERENNVTSSLNVINLDIEETQHQKDNQEVEKPENKKKIKILRILMMSLVILIIIFLIFFLVLVSAGGFGILVLNLIYSKSLITVLMSITLI